MRRQCDFSAYRYPTEYLVFGVEYPGIKEDVPRIRLFPNGGSEYRITDHLASVRTTLNGQGGAVTNTYDYEPFGDILNAGTEARQGFNSREKDQELDLFNNGVRKLDDEEGRFTSIDPLWEKFPAWSPYQYGYNNPIAVTDPGGAQGISFVAVQQMPVEPGGDPATAAALRAMLIRAQAQVAAARAAATTQAATLSTGTAAAAAPAAGASAAVVQTAVSSMLESAVALATVFSSSDASAGSGSASGSGGSAAGGDGNDGSGDDGGKKGSGRGRMQPAEGAQGAHTVFKTDSEGRVVKYDTFEPNSRKSGAWIRTKSYQSTGRAHTNSVTKQPVPTPHVQGPSIDGGVRPAHPSEMPQ